MTLPTIASRKYRYHACGIAVAAALVVTALGASSATRADDSASAVTRDSRLSRSALADLKENSTAAPEDTLGTFVRQFVLSKEDVITHQDELTPAERQKAAQDCKQQEDALETLMSSVSENLQTNLIEALARCQLLEQ